MNKKYRVTLTSAEREELRSLIKANKSNRRKLHRSWILLSADESDGGKRMTDEEISLAHDVGKRTVEFLRKRFVEEGLEIALNGKPREPDPSRIKVDGQVEAHLTALACSEAPAGYGRWSLRLLADRMVELQYIDSISHETVRRVLKKTRLSLGNRNTT